MLDVAIGVLVKPLTALALFLAAAYGARWLATKIPEGRVKRILFKRLTP